MEASVEFLAKLRERGVVRCIPAPLRALGKRVLGRERADESWWLEQYDAVLAEARRIEVRSDLPALGIIKDKMLRHSYYEAACLELGIPYEVIDISGGDWISCVRDSECQVLGLCFLFLYDGVSLCISTVTAVVSKALPRIPSTAYTLLSTVPKGGFLALLVAANLAFSIAGPQASSLRSRQYKEELQRMYEACAFVRDAGIGGDVLVAGSTGFVSLWTGRKVQSLLGQVGSITSSASLRIPSGVRFLMLDESKFAPYREKYMEPLVDACLPDLELVFKCRDTRVYQVLGD